jgi:ABC-type antimicrobial peptide transport system permease subunit
VAAAGIAIGVPLALAVMRLVANRMFGIGANDPLTIVGAIFAITIVAALAGLIPAFRASKVDPAVALRHE